MMKKVLALVISGTLVLGGATTAFAAESTSEELDLSALFGEVTDDNGELDLSALLGEVTDDNGELDLSGLLGEISDENGELDLSGLLGGITGEEGDLDLRGLFGSLGLSGEDGEGLDLGTLIGSLGLSGEDGEGLDLDGLLGSLGLADENGGLNLDGLFKEGGFLTVLLDKLASKGGVLAKIIGFFKDDSGKYSADRFMETLEGAVESEDGTSITINGEELTEKDLEDAFNGLSEQDIEEAVNGLIQEFIPAEGTASTAAASDEAA